MKYYGTMTMIYLPKEIHEKYNIPNHRDQYRIVFKAKSRAEANRNAEALGLFKKTFKSDYTRETGNEKEIQMCDKYNNIIKLGNDYYSLEKILEEKKLIK